MDSALAHGEPVQLAVVGRLCVSGAKGYEQLAPRDTLFHLLRSLTPQAVKGKDLEVVGIWPE